MFKGFCCGNPLRGIQHQTLIQKIDKFLQVLRDFLILENLVLQILLGVNIVLGQEGLALPDHQVTLCIEILVCQMRLFEQFLIWFSTNLDDLLKDFGVVSAIE